MKTVEITCDFCHKEIRDRVLYGTLKMPMLEESHFCGICCFDDWILKVYLRNRKF